MPLEQPQQSYYPRALLRLTVRIDEFGQGSRLQKAPAKTTKNLKGVKDERNDLEAVPDPAAPDGSKRLLLVPKGSSPGNFKAGPQSRLSSGDGFTFDVTVVPKECTWSMNGIRTADTLNATIPLSILPIDPRTIRSVAVELILGCVDEKKHVAQARGKDTGPVIDDEYTDASGTKRSNVRFQGFADEWSDEWGEDEMMLRLDCRDNTQLLIDQECPPKLVLDMSKGIDEAVATYLSHFPQMAGVSVEYRPAGDAPPKLKDSLGPTAFLPKLGPQPNSGGGKGKLSVWDYLTDVCGAVGHNIRVEGTLIVIQRVRSLMTNSATRRPDDPFTGRTLSTGERVEYRRFIYGRNVKTLSIKRKFAKTKPKNIEVRSYGAEKKNTIVARFPLPKDRQVYALPGDGTSEQEWAVIKIGGIKDDKTARAVAQAYYESQGRNELQVEVKTRNMGSFGGGNSDPDVLDMKAGDTFEVLIQQDDKEFSTATRIEKQLGVLAANEKLMTSLGMSPEFAAAYAKAYVDAGFVTVFRLKQMAVSWSVEEGVDLTVTGINYIEIRADRLLPQGEEPSNTVVAP